MQSNNETEIYVCKQAFALYEYDEDGYCTEDLVQINVGSRWVANRDKPLRIAANDAVHLDSISGEKWIEVIPETFERCFEKLDVRHIWDEACDLFSHMKRIDASEFGFCQRCRVNPECQFSK